MGVNLHSDKKEVAVWGDVSLEKSLAEMYGAGGYVYHFNDKDFFWKEGLGNMEVITNKSQRPIEKEFIENPVEEMIDLGVEFIFKKNK